MTGAELIKWIQDNHAEDMKVMSVDSDGAFEEVDEDSGVDIMYNEAIYIHG